MYHSMQPLSDSGASYLVIFTPKAYLETCDPSPLFSWGNGAKKPREVGQLPKTPLQVGEKVEDLLQGSLKPAPSADQVNYR